MKTLLALIMIVVSAQFSILTAQATVSRYEAEILMNPNPGGKDTREINAVLVFEKNSVKIFSRRNEKIYKEFRYSEIEFIEHSFSKRPVFELTKTAVITMLFTGLPIDFNTKEKHWLSISSKDDFAVLKIENDNYRLIKMEFLVRNINLDSVNEDKL